MSVGRFTDYKVNAWLDAEATAGYYIALHYENPDISGAAASEIFGGTYARVLTPFTVADNRIIWNSAAIKFFGLPNIVITHVAGWDAQINGNMIWSSSFDGLVRLYEGNRVTMPAFKIALSIN